MSKPRGVMLSDCLHIDVVTDIAALKFSAWMARLNPLSVIRPATDPSTKYIFSCHSPETRPLFTCRLAVESIF